MIEKRIAGYAALLQAFCYVSGFVILATVMNPGDTTAWSRLEKLTFVLQQSTLFQIWHLVIYVVFGVALVVLSAMLHRLLVRSEGLLMSMATPFGMIWSGLVIASGMVASVGLTTVAGLHGSDPDEAVRVWTALSAVQDGLGGGVEVVGGLWVLLLSIASLRCGVLWPKFVDIIGIVVGLAGIATIAPPLTGLGAIFGLTQIVWFVAVGVCLLRTQTPPKASAKGDAS